MEEEEKVRRGGLSAQNPKESITWGEQKERVPEDSGNSKQSGNKPRRAPNQGSSRDQAVVPNTSWLLGLSKLGPTHGPLPSLTQRVPPRLVTGPVRMQSGTGPRAAKGRAWGGHCQQRNQPEGRPRDERSWACSGANITRI